MEKEAQVIQIRLGVLDNRRISFVRNLTADCADLSLYGKAVARRAFMQHAQLPPGQTIRPTMAIRH